MARPLGAIVAGFIVWSMVAGFAALAARHGWPAYAAVEKERAYSLWMYLARLAAGMAATLAGGATAAWVDRRSKQTAFMFGALLLLISVVHHIRIWDQYPVWYHLFYLAYIVPLALLGAKLFRLAITQ